LTLRNIHDETTLLHYYVDIVLIIEIKNTQDFKKEKGINNLFLFTNLENSILKRKA